LPLPDHLERNAEKSGHKIQQQINHGELSSEELFHAFTETPRAALKYKTGRSRLCDGATSANVDRFMK
jgi:hypothetical protein